MKIKSGDKVYIQTGDDKGQQGQVKNVYPDQGKVLVEGVNMKKKHVKPKKEGEKGQIVEVAHPIEVSNVQLVCPHCGQPTRLEYHREKSGEKHRRCKKCGKIID